MIPNFELGAKHNENRKNARLAIEEMGSLSTKEVVKSLYNKSIGLVPSAKAAYDDYLGLVVTLEEIAKVKPEAASLLVDQIVAQEILNIYGNLNIFDINNVYAVLCSEPGRALLNLMGTKAEKTANGYKIVGIKQVATEQLNADKFFVFANDEEGKTRVFELSKNQVNVTFGVAAFIGSNVKINQIEINTEITDSVAVINDDFEKIQTISRTLIAAVSTGIAHSALISGINAVKQTKGADGLALSSTQSSQFSLADMFADLESGRVLLYYSANSLDANQPSIKFATMAKIQATNTASKVSMEALELMGNAGYLADNDFADSLKIAINNQVRGGTNRVQKNQLFKYMLAGKK